MIELPGDKNKPFDPDEDPDSFVLPEPMSPDARRPLANVTSIVGVCRVDTNTKTAEGKANFNDPGWWWVKRSN